MSRTDRRAVALAGCGRWGANILRDLCVLGCEVTVADPDIEARAKAEAGGAVSVVASIDQLHKVDGVVIATPTVTHADVTMELLEREVPVFVEKPLTADAATARALAERAPDRLFVMDKWQYHPAIEALASLAASGELGEVVGVETKRIDWGNPHDDVDAVWVLAPHDISIIRSVLGRVPDPSAAVGDVVDGTLMGVTALFEGTPWARATVSARSPQRRREVTVFGSEAVAQMADGYDSEVHVFDSRASRVDRDLARRTVSVSNEWPLLRELRTFVEHLDGGPPPRATAADGATTVAIIEQIHRLAGVAVQD